MCPGVIKTRVNDETSARRDASQKGDSKRVTSEVKGQRGEGRICYPQAVTSCPSTAAVKAQSHQLFEIISI